MNIQLLPNNKVIMYDATNLGPSSMKLPDGNCRPVPGRPGEVDCSAHAVEYDVQTAKVGPLKVLSNTWCSSGGLTVDGNLISTGGTDEGNQSVRILNPCKGCDFKERLDVLAAARWSSSQEKLEDGNFILVGGRREFSYEQGRRQDSIVFTRKRVDLPFLRLTTTDKYENNLYPFVHLLPDGNIFLLANRRSIIIDTKTDKVVRELPLMPGGSRGFPASGMSALLPLKISNVNGSTMEAEVMVCGGAKPEAAEKAEKDELLWAMTDCGRLMVTNPDAQWELELMPTRRVMGDMLLLPTAEVLLLNGATQGVSGLSSADLPNLTPLLYTPEKKVKHRFKSLKPTEIPRMYQSSAAVLPDGNVLVAGSNPNKNYDFQAKFPTELRVEKFTPRALLGSRFGHPQASDFRR
ncbi:hypothetical protein Vadar_022165 [Vaccinium darrowii]|uniref:Uncharacterized protein n=1 Tax=Vaccinium darrowii TaxID=229202 RepID=A0ACB7YPX0_9ERIC|nr:hypothetical protein Vadar_022165 [Vaccinium darrowii]